MDITAGHSPLHLRSDHVVVVHHRVRVHELTHGLHFSFGRLGFLGDLLTELQRGEALELGGLVPELCVGLLETLEVPAHRALLVVLGVEVDEDQEERDEDEDADAGDDGGHEGGGLHAGRGRGQDGGPVLGVRRVAGGGVGQVALRSVPVLPQSEKYLMSTLKNIYQTLLCMTCPRRRCSVRRPRTTCTGSASSA